MNLTDFKPIQDICATSQGAYSIECLKTHFCPQFDHYYRNVGVTVCLIYLASGWLLFAFWKYIYPRIEWGWLFHPDNSFFFGILGDMRRLERCIYWDNLIRNAISKLLFGFIVVFLYLEYFSK